MGPASVDHFAYCKTKYLYIFVGTVMLVPASLAVHRLTLVCVCAYSCVFHVCKSLKFEGWAVVVMVPQQYFHLRNCECSTVQ